MAEISKSGTSVTPLVAAQIVGAPSLATTLPCAAHQTAGLSAGEALAAGDACYIKSDGKVWRSTGAAVAAAAKVDGFAAQAATPSGEAVTLFHGVAFNYGSGLTPGARLYLSGTVVGGLADAASTGGTAAVAVVIDATRIYLMKSTY